MRLPIMGNARRAAGVGRQPLRRVEPLEPARMGAAEFWMTASNE
jgi:hypothetical protein